MARDEDEDLYDEEFDFVDDEESDLDGDESDASDMANDADSSDSPLEGARTGQDEEVVDEYGRPEPLANYVVHVYEYKKYKRTIDRPFTPEDAEAFATEYNRTSKSYGRFAVTGKNDAKPKKTMD